MRRICSGIAVLALALAGGCKSNHDRASERADKARHEVGDQQKDVRESESKETQARRDMQQQQRELGTRGRISRRRIPSTRARCETG
jgi:hypothetical protein